MRRRGGSGKKRTTWLARLVRGWWPDRNPLRRRSDRFETAVLGVLTAAFLAGAPYAAHAAESWIYPASVREQQAQSAAVHQVPATLLQAAPGWSGYTDGSQVEAQWRAPDGQVRTSLVYVTSGTPVGSTVMVWTNRAGQLTGPPLQGYQVATRVGLAEALAVAALAVALGAVGGLVHWALGRRRLAAWDADWLATGPRWSPRR